MNRESKFRAWDEENKRMWYSHEFGESEGSDAFFTEFTKEGLKMYVMGEDPYGDHTCFRRDLPKMEFTGLHDENNVEIYEGDIIHHAPLRATFYIKYYESGARFETTKLFDNYLESNWMYYDDYEVIGNIYENPELLKASK